MKRFLRQFFARFARNERGVIAIQFAMISVPMVAFSGIAVDYSKVISIRKQLQDIADSTVIAGARLPATSSDRRLSEANHMIAASLTAAKLGDATFNVNASNANVTIDLNYSYKTSLMGVLGVERFDISVKSAAQSQVENGGVACLISLNETTDDGLHLQGINKVSSRNCWTWVNSNSPTSINAVGAAIGTGQGFCTHGGASGADHFDPQPYTQCDIIDDPFANTFRNAPSADASCQHTDLSLKNDTFVLQPGVYCGNTVLKPQANVTMMPGVYEFRDGYLEVQGQASLSGKGVTLHFNGNNTQFIVRGGGHVDLKAPAEGDYAGFVMVEPKRTGSSVRETIIQGGGRIKIEGIVYAPLWRVNIGGNGEINQESHFFAMVADHYYMEGNGRLYVQSDANGAGLPDLMPRIKSGPRLLY